MPSNDHHQFEWEETLNSTHGNVKICGDSKYIHTWKFHIFSGEYVIRIGISAAEVIDVEKGIKSNSESNYYLFSNGGWKYTKQYQGSCSTGFHNKDYVTMMVNPYQKTIRYTVSSDENGKIISDDVTFKDIDFENKTYRMAIKIGDSPSGVRLVHFDRKCLSQ